MPWVNGHYVPYHDFTQEYEAGQKKIRADLMDEQFTDLTGVFDLVDSSAVKKNPVVQYNIESVTLPSPYENTFLGKTIQLSGSYIDPLNGACFLKTITEPTVFSFNATIPTICVCFSLILTNAGGYTITWPVGVKWTIGEAPILAVNGIDVLSFLSPNGGNTWYGVHNLSGAS